jgi:WASH complex subunit CCDC53
LINNFVLNTAVFLNSFAETVERKISIVSNKVTELEILLTVLEEKLNSVPGLEVEGSAPVPQASAPVSQPAPTTSATTAPPPSTPAPPSGPSSAPPPPALAAQEAPVEAPKPSLADDPDYAPFVKMIKVGVPKFVVVAKATAAGLDGARLEAFEP